MNEASKRAQPKQIAQTAMDNGHVPVFLAAMCELLMCSDPWPASQQSEEDVKHGVNVMASKLGFSDWVEAYHDLCHTEANIARAAVPAECAAPQRHVTDKGEFGQLFVVVKCWAGAETLVAHTTGNGGLRFSAHTNTAEAQASADQMNKNHCTGANLYQVRPLKQRHSGIPHDSVCFFKDGAAWCCVRGDFLNLQESPAGFGGTMEDALHELHAQCTTASPCRPRQTDTGEEQLEPFWCHEQSHDRARCETQCAECAEDGVVGRAAPEPSGETIEQREEVCAAWHALPDDLRQDHRLTRLYHALGGPRMENPADVDPSGYKVKLPYTEAIRKAETDGEFTYSTDQDFANPEKYGWERVYGVDHMIEYGNACARAALVALGRNAGVQEGDGTGQTLPPVSNEERTAHGVALPRDDQQGYVDAFYEMAAMLGVEGAQAKSPQQVYAEQVRPALERLKQRAHDAKGPRTMADQFDREDVEAVADCLGDDAAQLRQENDEDERADNMDRAASMLTWMLLTHPAYAAGVLARQPQSTTLAELDAAIDRWQGMHDTADDFSDEPERDRAELAALLKHLRAYRALLASGVPASGEPEPKGGA